MRLPSLNIVDWPLWKPAGSLMRRMRFPGKMLSIVVPSAASVLWLFSNFMIGSLANVETAVLEETGVTYLQALHQIQGQSQLWRMNEGTGAMPVNWGAAWTALAKTHGELAPGLSLPSDRLSALTGLQQRAESASADLDRLLVLNEIEEGALNLMGEVTDQSTLSLDPALDSYYLMSASQVRAPWILHEAVDLEIALKALARAEGQSGTPAYRDVVAASALLAIETERIMGDLRKLEAGTEAAAVKASMAGVVAINGWAKTAQEHARSGKLDAADAKVLAEQGPPAIQSFRDEVPSWTTGLKQELQNRKHSEQRGIWLVIGVLTVSLGLAVYLIMGFYRSMNGGFKILRRHLLNISMGDLRKDIDSRGNDEISGLLRDMHAMQLALRDMVTMVQKSSDSVVLASQEISAGTQDLSNRTEAAAAALEESSAALEQTSSSVKMTAESAGKAAEIAMDNARVAVEGGQAMDEMVRTMERIHASSGKINDIISVIDGIAFQTNILALNAAVEAARAGEQGRGFAVVASEVRHLAQRSAEAAREIKSLISVSVEEVSGGMNVVKKAGSAMHHLVSHAGDARALLEEVANGTREQSLGISQVGVAVQELDRNTQANVALVEETAAAAASQSEAAIRMAAQVDEFRVPGQQNVKVEGVDVDAIIDAHRQWKVKLRDAIESHAKVDVRTLSKDDCCALGKWIYGEGQRLRAKASFVTLVERHKRFHTVAGGVGELINDGRYRQAEDALAPGTAFAKATNEVVSTLSAAKRLGF